MIPTRPVRLAVLVAALAICSSAKASITLDYSSLGTVYQDGTGILYDLAGAGRTDVTSLFEGDLQTAANYLN